MGRIKKITSALRSGSLKPDVLAQQFNNQYGIVMDLSTCIKSTDGLNRHSINVTEHLDYAWIQSQLTSLIEEKEPENIGGINKIMKRLRKGKWTFEKVDHVYQ